MKFFDCDWNEIFDALPLWDKLSAGARRHFLLAVPSHAQSVSESGYGSDLALVVEAGLVVRASPGRVKPAPTRIGFRRILAQLAKFPLFDVNDLKVLLGNYLTKHFSWEETGIRRVDEESVSDDNLDWLNRFLAASEGTKWERPFKTVRYPRTGGYQTWYIQPKQSSVEEVITYFGKEQAFSAAQCLVRHAMAASGPVLLSAAREILPEPLRPCLADAFKGCVRYRLLYPALRQTTLEALYWVHPKIGSRLHRPPPRVPVPAEVKSLCSPSFLMNDLAQILVEAAAGECRLKKQGWSHCFFTKVEAKLKAELEVLPDWLSKRFPPDQRLRHAHQLLGFLKMAEAKAGAAGASLQPLPEGLKWLKQPARDRLRDLIVHLRKNRGLSEYDYSVHFNFLPGDRVFIDGSAKPADLGNLLEAAWRQAPAQESVPLAEFLDYHARVSHPLTGQTPLNRRLRAEQEFRGVPLNEENVEDIWRNFMDRFFWDRLVPLGGVDTGLDGESRLGFRLNPVGQCLLGLRDDFEYGQLAAPGGVVVQPNFEIVFVQPNIAAEIELAAFAARCGKGVGTLFRLTRKAIIQAAATGTTFDQVLHTLQRHTTKALPANVVEEIRSWFASCRRLPVRHTHLIEAGDRETSVRLQRLLGTDCAPLTGTLLEWRVSRIDPNLRKQLNQQGLFLD